jgi:hypothetical protein
LHKQQAFEIDVKGHKYATIAIDYTEFPRGLSDDRFLEVGGITFNVAERLANQIRGS